MAGEPGLKQTHLSQHGELITQDPDIEEHILAKIPVQIYLQDEHEDIGFIDAYTSQFIKMNQVCYNRNMYTFISRPGY